MFTKLIEKYYGIEHLINVNKICEIEKCRNFYGGGSQFYITIYFENRKINFNFQDIEERDKAFEELEQIVNAEKGE